jgi:hypothetical protein
VTKKFASFNIAVTNSVVSWVFTNLLEKMRMEPSAKGQKLCEALIVLLVQWSLPPVCRPITAEWFWFRRGGSGRK